MLRKRALVAALAATLLIGAGAGPSGADTIAGAQFGAGPTTGLVDGQAILIGGTGFAPDTTFNLYECRNFSDCVPIGQSATTDGDGRFAAVIQVQRGLDDSGTPVDCSISQCYLGVSSKAERPVYFQDLAAEAIELRFATRPAVSVLHNRRLTDGQTVTVEGRDLVPGQTVSVLECVGSPCTHALPGSGVVGRDGRVTITTTVERWVYDWAADGGDLPMDCSVTPSCGVALALHGYYEDDYERLASAELNFAPTPAFFAPGTGTWEGDSGTHPVEVRFGVTPSSHRPQVVRYRTFAWTATAADFVPVQGTVTLPAGATEGSVMVEVRGDTAVEPDEVFLVELRGTGRLSNVGAVAPVWIGDPEDR